MTDPDAAGGGGEYQVVVGKSLHLVFYLSIDRLSFPHLNWPNSRYRSS